MTMPHLMNCPHSGDGWCLDCVGKLNSEFTEEKAIVNRIWAQLGITNYEQAGGKSIYGLIADLQNEVKVLRAERGELPPDAHPDEAKPRGATWLAERSNWLSETLRLRDHIHAMESAIEPFAKIVRDSDNRIPTERLSYANWHALTKVAPK
jgi:hypothetical protein